MMKTFYNYYMNLPNLVCMLGFFLKARRSRLYNIYKSKDCVPFHSRSFGQLLPLAQPLLPPAVSSKDEDYIDIVLKSIAERKGNVL